MKRSRSLWPTEEAPTFAEVLTQPVAHTCSPVEQAIEDAYAGRIHPVADCPGYRTLAEICAEAVIGEGEH